MRDLKLARLVRRARLRKAALARAEEVLDVDTEASADACERDEPSDSIAARGGLLGKGKGPGGGKSKAQGKR